MKKNIVYAVLSAVFFVFLSCSTSKEITKAADPVTRTLIAAVVAEKTVLVGEFEDGSKVIEENIAEKVLTWEGFQLLLRTEEGKTYEYLSHEPFFNGDRVIIVVQDGKVLSVKFAP